MKNYTLLLSLVATGFAGKALGDCFSTKLGFPCCPENTEVVFQDADGDWGIDNDDWCGISAPCWSTKLGFPCCSDAASTVYYTDADGKWGVENDDWCGIVGSGTTPSNPQTPSQPTTPEPTTPHIDNMQEFAKSYMAKLEIIQPIPADVNNAVTGVKVEKRTYDSKVTGNTRRMNVILPPNYSTDKKYPVLYYLHGIMGNEDSMLSNSMGSKNMPVNLFKEGKAKEMILVLPDEYAPPPGKAVEPGLTQAYFEGYDNFIHDLVDEIMPFMEKNYSIATGRDNTAVAGFSFGGRTALYIGYTRPDLFGYVGAFSPAPGVVPGLFRESEFKIKEPEKYTPYVTIISGGTTDTVVGTNPEKYHTVLTKNNQPHIWISIPNGNHDGKAVVIGFYNFLRGAFGQLN